MTYTVKDLKELINDLPDEMIVVLSSDEEGNSFSTLSGHGFGRWEEYDDEGEFTSWETDEDGEETGEEIPFEDATAICLWP